MLKNLPNMLTIARIACIPLLCLSVLIPGRTGDAVAVLLCAVAGATDFLDGWIARKLNVQSDFGRMFDPIADKMFVSLALLMLVHERIVVGIHAVPASIILAREIFISGLREYLMASRIRLPVSSQGKYKTLAQMISISILLSDEAGEDVMNVIRSGFVDTGSGDGLTAKILGLAALWIASFLAIGSACRYVLQWSAPSSARRARIPRGGAARGGPGLGLVPPGK